MTGQRRTLTAIVAALVCVACLSGCGGDRSLEKVKKAGVIRIGMSAGYPPFTYYNSNNEMVGFDVAFSQTIAKRMGVKARLVAVPWKDIITGLAAGDYDAIVGSMAVTAERAKLIDFSEPYYYARSQVMVPKDSPVKSVKELQAKTVGVMEGSTYEDDAKTLGALQVHRYKTNDDVIAGLRSGEVDAIITDDVVGNYAKTAKGFEIEPLGNTLSTDKISVGVRKGDDALRKKIDSIIGEMNKDGTLRGLVEKMASGKLDRP